MEGGAFGLGEEIGRPDMFAIGVVAVEIPHLDILHMDMAAGRDVGGGEADDLVVFADLGAGGDIDGGDFMAARDGLQGGRRLARHCHTGEHFNTGGDDIVGGVEPDGERRVGHGGGSLRWRRPAAPDQARSTRHIKRLLLADIASR